MSVGQNLVGKVFHVGQYSTGTVANPSTDPLVYTEMDDAPGSAYGAGDVTFTAVTTDANGVTTISGTIQTEFGKIPASGTLVGNDTDDFLINGTIAGQSGYIFLTNEQSVASPMARSTFAKLAAASASGGQPGVGNTALVAAEATAPTYDPNANAPCFVTGTLIRTTRGKCAVEDLVVGDVAVTALGEARPIVWIGHRDTDCRGKPDLKPVRVAAHAFGDNLPERDLTLSPGHPVLVGADADNAGGHLVPIMCLINGTTIARVAVDEVTYWHIELDQHDILLAEGLPAESYINLGSLRWFAGADGALFNPDMALPGMPGRCRPVAIDGPVVEAERRRLDQMFATKLEAAAAWPAAVEQLFAL